nr:MAG TPA: hypothetical protein [Caudoviricetes sp.]
MLDRVHFTLRTLHISGITIAVPAERFWYFQTVTCSLGDRY